MSEAAGIRVRHVHGGDGERYLFETMGSGVAAADFDGDGLPDLLFLQSGTLPADEFSDTERAAARHAAGETAQLYRNLGDMRFEDVTAGSGFDVAFYAQGLAVGDVDGDGDRDVWVATYGRSRLYLNEGGMRFREVGRERGLDDPLWTVAGAFFDADGDGDLDLYSVAYLDMPVDAHVFCGPSRDVRTYCHVDRWPGLDDRLWINDGRGSFHDGSAAAGLPGTRGKGLAAVASDLDDDGDVDVFVANDSQANLLLVNDGKGGFSDEARRAGMDLNAEGRTEACMGTDAGDLDGDGDLDLYIANFEQETNTLYRNDGRLFFTDVSTSSGSGVPSLSELGFGVVLLDAENDGDLDVYVANGHIMDNVESYQPGTMFAQPDQLYLNDGRGRFRLAPAEVGPSLSEPRVGRGVARADLDRDGDTDLVVSNNEGAPWVLRNDLASAHRLVLRLQGPGGRADAEGARVTLQAGSRTIVRELVSGAGYASHSDTELVIGLGDAEHVESLTVRWPGGASSEHGPWAADRRYTLAFGGELLADQALPAPSPGDR
ncbi:MAG: CRTAC1 family protein [Planctomycetota bacterium]